MKFTGVLVALLLAAACGISYTVPKSAIGLELTDIKESAKAGAAIEAFLSARGFVRTAYFPNAMAHTLPVATNNGATNSGSTQRYQSQTWFGNKSLAIDVILVGPGRMEAIDESNNGEPSAGESASHPVVEIDVLNYRPGGFGPAAHTLHNELKSYLLGKYGRAVSTMIEPPATNDDEYNRVNRTNIAVGATWWAAVFSIALLLVGAVLRILLRKTTLRRAWKRVMFTLIAAPIVTPLPFPAGFITTVTLPSVFALPLVGTDYFTRVQSFAWGSFCVSVFLCAGISLLLFRDSDNQTSIRQSIPVNLKTDKQ